MEKRTLGEVGWDRTHADAVRCFLDRAREASGGRLGEVILFGSHARGDAREGSDVDLLLVWEGSPMTALRALVPIATDVLLETGVDIAIHPVSNDHLATLRRIRTGFYENVEREGVIVAG